MSPTPANHSKGNEKDQNSSDRFGYQWHYYHQLLPESREQLQSWLGSTSIDSFKGMTVLDVGCGMGRNSYWLLQAGAKQVLAIDVDRRTVAAARRNLSVFQQVTVEECSVYDLDPMRVGKFDRLVCIGVLHHLEFPTLALRKMWLCLREGGVLLLWCYADTGNALLKVIQCLRIFGSRAPLPITHLLAKLITTLLWPIILYYPWKTEYYRKLKQRSFRNVETIVFDQLIPCIARYWTKNEVESLIAFLPGTAQIELAQGNSWHIRIRKEGELVE